MALSWFHDAGLFDENGKLLGSATSPIQIWKDGDCVEVTISIRNLDFKLGSRESNRQFFLEQQSSTDIWHAVCAAVKSACSLANVSEIEVKGIGFAATCSLGL